MRVNILQQFDTDYIIRYIISIENNKIIVDILKPNRYILWRTNNRKLRDIARKSLKRYLILKELSQ